MGRVMPVTVGVWDVGVLLMAFEDTRKVSSDGSSLADFGKSISIADVTSEGLIAQCDFTSPLDEGLASGAPIVIVYGSGGWTGRRKRFWSQLNSKTVRCRPYVSIRS